MARERARRRLVFLSAVIASWTEHGVAVFQSDDNKMSPNEAKAVILKFIYRSGRVLQVITLPCRSAILAGWQTFYVKTVRPDLSVAVPITISRLQEEAAGGNTCGRRVERGRGAGTALRNELLIPYGRKVRLTKGVRFPPHCLDANRFFVHFRHIHICLPLGNSQFA